MGVFVIGSSLPEWLVWFRTPDPHYSVVPAEASFWEAIHDPSARSQWNERNSLITALLLLVAVGIGSLVYWIGMSRRRPLEAADYKEAAGGAIPDGRIDSVPPSTAGPPTA